MAWPSATDRAGSTATFTSACNLCPNHLALTSETSSTPGTWLAACLISSMTSGSTPSSKRVKTALPDCQTITRMAAAIKSPTMGSASGYPSHTPTAPAKTARLVQPSVLAWYPSATSAALPISLPTLMRNTATASLPMKPTKEAAATIHRNPTGWGLMSRSRAWYPATTALKRMMRTMTTPAKSSTLPYPNVKRLLTPRRVSAKAIPSGMAVAAPPKLWMVSESRATLPESSTTTSCKRAVAISPHERPLDGPYTTLGGGYGWIHSPVGMAVSPAPVVVVVPVFFAMVACHGGDSTADLVLFTGVRGM